MAEQIQLYRQVWLNLSVGHHLPWGQSFVIFTLTWFRWSVLQLPNSLQIASSVSVWHSTGSISCNFLGCQTGITPSSIPITFPCIWGQIAVSLTSDWRPCTSSEQKQNLRRLPSICSIEPNIGGWCDWRLGTSGSLPQFVSFSQPLFFLEHQPPFEWFVITKLCSVLYLSQVIKDQPSSGNTEIQLPKG